MTTKLFSKGPLDRTLDAVAAVRKLSEKAHATLPTAQAGSTGEIAGIKKMGEELANRLARLE